MSVTDYPIKHPPEVDAATFRAVLASGGSPALAEADAMYAALVAAGVSPLVFLGVFWVESKLGTTGIVKGYDTKNPGNVRTPEVAGAATLVQTPRGQFARYPSWAAAARDWAARLTGPKYAGRGLTTLRQVIPVYAPGVDSNYPDAYIAAVLARIAAWGGATTQPTQGGTMTPQIIDVRSQLPFNPNGGQRGQRVNGYGPKFGPKQGIIVHYNGPAVNRQGDPLALLIADANWHIGPYLGEAGIAYHYDIGEDAVIRLCRDPDAVLWHCASWPENATWYSVHVMIGDGQSAHPAQLQALGDLCEHLATQDGFPDGNVKGHQEVSATSCPGALMGDFVLPWRAGTFPLAAYQQAEVVPVSNYVKFPETGKGIMNGFRDYWESQGGLRHFGLPLTDELQEVCADGVTRTVQYFERSRFEWHPDAPAGYTIQESRLGAVAAKAAGLHGAGID